MMAELIASVFQSFVEEMPPCDQCPHDCHQLFALMEDGLILPRRPDEMEALSASIWARWEKCPRKYESTYAIDEGDGSLAELCRSEYDKGSHQKALPAGGEYLLRIYSMIKERPRNLREHISIEKSKAGRS